MPNGPTIEPLAGRFYAFIDDEMAMIVLPESLRSDETLSYIVASHIKLQNGPALQMAVAEHIGAKRAEMFPGFLKLFLSTLTKQELKDLGGPEVAPAVGPSPIDAAAEEQEGGASDRGASNVNSTRTSSLSKDEFATVDFNEEKPTSSPSVSNFAGVSVSDALSKYLELGDLPFTPLLDFYRGITTRPFPGEGLVHVGEWYVNLPLADVDDLILSSRIASILFPHVEVAEDGADYNHGTVKLAEMWWLTRDAVAQKNIVDITTGFFSALDITVEWSTDKLTAVLIVKSTVNHRIEEALKTTTAANVLLQIADFLGHAGQLPLSKATRALLEGYIG